MVVQHSSTGGLACRHDVAPHGALQTPRTQVAGRMQGGLPGPPVGMVVGVVGVGGGGAIVVGVVFAGAAATGTRSSTPSSTSAFTVGESVVLWQSFGFFASSFMKQPFAGSSPPVYFATALSTQPFVFGSAGFPGVWASLRHLSRAARYFDAHFFLPAPHFV